MGGPSGWAGSCQFRTSSFSCDFGLVLVRLSLSLSLSLEVISPASRDQSESLPQTAAADRAHLNYADRTVNWILPSVDSGLNPSFLPSIHYSPDFMPNHNEGEGYAHKITCQVFLFLRRSLS